MWHTRELVRRDKQDERLYCLTGECSRDLERGPTKLVPVASLILRPSRSSFLMFKSILTDVGPVELWATRPALSKRSGNKGLFGGRDPIW